MVGRIVAILFTAFSVAMITAYLWASNGMRVPNTQAQGMQQPSMNEQQAEDEASWNEMFQRLDHIEEKIPE